MDKSCHSTGECTSSSITSNNRDHYLNHLNKISHKISKPTTTIIKNPTFDSPPAPTPPPLPPPQQAQSQPPVYNINKSDFRDVVQRLIGSPAHERLSTPQPIQPPKPQSSRLQRIRPPPLAQISNSPPPLLNSAVNPNPPPFAAASSFIHNQRQIQPLSPLPPFPTVHAAADSPISAYMRYLHNSISTIDSDPKQFSALSPLAPPPTTAQSQFPTPYSPLPFGCLPSPRSPYPLFSPNMMGQLGFQQFPVSPRLSIPSPRWKE